MRKRYNERLLRSDGSPGIWKPKEERGNDENMYIHPFRGLRKEVQKMENDGKWAGRLKA